MNKLMLFWLNNRQDILVGLFCLLLIFLGAKNLHNNLNLLGRSGMVWVGWMALVIGASMVLGVALNKIAVREEKTLSAGPEKEAKPGRNHKKS